MTGTLQPTNLPAEDALAGQPARPSGLARRRVLVAYASRHGATREIAHAIGARLEEGAAGRASGVMAVVLPVEQHPDPAPYDAVVLGSAVYAGRWLEPARDYVTRYAATLRDRQVWLFSSGPIGAPPYPADEPHDVGPLRTITGAREHVIFPGRLDKQLLGFGERAIVTAMRAPVGDFRDWDAVRAWSDAIAGQLAEVCATAG